MDPEKPQPMAAELHHPTEEAPMMTSAEVIDCQRLEPGSLIDVETKNRHYRIECVSGNTIRVSGHPEYCPAPVLAELQGSVDREGMVDRGLIERGMRLMFVLDKGLPVTTSKVLNVHLDQPEVDRPGSAHSVH
jgi:hypothetical protein